MAEPRFGAERIKDVPPLNLLDALLAQGAPVDLLQQMMGMATSEITSFWIRQVGDRYALDRAVNMAQGKEQEELAGAKTEYDRLKISFKYRGIDISDYKGAKEPQALVSWAAGLANGQALDNAIATSLPAYRNLGGRAIGDDVRRNVTGFSAPVTDPDTGRQLTPITTRGVPQSPGYGVRGQGGAGAGTDAGPGAPTLSGATSTPAAPAAPGAGPGAPATPAAKPLSPDQIKADIQTRYGWGAALMDIPEVAAILNRVGSGPGQINAEEADRLFKGTDWYRSTSETQRKWKVLEGTNPGDAKAQLQLQIDSITAKAQTQGVTVAPERIRQIAEMSKRNGWSDQMINAALASEIRWDPDGTKTGVMAQVKAAQQSMLVPMSDQTMTQWAQAIVSGAKSVEDFQGYLKDQAKSLFPTMANYLDTTPGGDVRTYLDPYAETIGKTLGMNPGDIDWMDPKWYRFVNSSDPKTGERRTVDIADVQRTLIVDPQYNYDSTANGKTQKASLARNILEDWGFMAKSSQGGF